MNKTFALVKILVVIVALLHTTISLAQIKLNIERCYELLENQNEDIKHANLKILINEVEIKDAKNSYLPTLVF